MGHIIKSLSFCHSVNLSVNTPKGRNFDSILMKFCTVIRGLKSKIEFVWDKKNLITPSFILPKNFYKFALRPVGTLKRYIWVP